MGAQLSKGGVAVEGKAAADPAAAKANGQVGEGGLMEEGGRHMAPNAHWQHGCQGYCSSSVRSISQTECKKKKKCCGTCSRRARAARAPRLVSVNSVWRSQLKGGDLPAHCSDSRRT